MMPDGHEVIKCVTDATKSLKLPGSEAVLPTLSRLIRFNPGDEGRSAMKPSGRLDCTGARNGTSGRAKPGEAFRLLMASWATSNVH